LRLFNKKEKNDKKKMMKILSICGAVIAAFIAMVVVTGATIINHDEKLLATHIHPLLNVLVNGKPISVPKDIGIESSLHKDHSLDQYGADGAAAPLHTHDVSGTIHVESTVNRNYTLGEFLDIWGIDLHDKMVKLTVDGIPVSDYRNHILEDGQNLNLYITT
jgi:hypothetical protein